ncbi:MAG: hypothetical protein HY359_13435 [Candidatus Rokubacteria bacterium]|nr:hypothetical protein [Candidatus Rokubacteria bacterium]
MITRAGWLALGAGALGLTLLVTWPLARCLGTCLGEPPDTLLSVYFLAWVAHGLLTPGVRLTDASLFAPYPGTLALGDYMPAYAPVAVPIVAATGNPVLAHNVLLVLSHTGAALGAVALAVRLTGAWAPALVAGVAFAYAPRLLDQAYNLETLSVFWFPWLLLGLERFLERPTWPRATLVAGLWLAIALSSLKIFVFGTLLAATFLAAAVALGGRRLGRAHALPLAGVGVVAVALLIWVILAPNRTLAREWGLGRTLDEVTTNSATLRDLVALPREDLLRRLLGVGGDLGHDRLVPGVTATALAAAGLVAVARGRAGLRRALVPYVVLLGVALVLALGPALATPWGAIPLPYRVLYAAVPGFDAIRTPGRFLVFVDFGLALLAAGGAAWWAARARPSARRLGVAALVVVILAESMLVPYPGAVPRLDPGSVPAVYRWLAQQEARTVALAIPMGDWVNVAAAAFHLRPTVNGWSSYFPPRYTELVKAMERFPDARTLALARGAGVELVLVDREWITPERAAALAAFPAVLRPERAFPTHLVYRVPRERPGLERVEATAAAPAGAACVTLRNPGPDWVPLYPLHRLHLAVEGAGVEATRWLPLDLPPGGGHTACVPLPAPAAARLRGAVEDGGRAYRFVVSAGGPPQRLEPAP